MKTSKNLKSLTHDRLGKNFDHLLNEYDVSRRLEVMIDDFLDDVKLKGQLVLDAGCGTGRGTKRLLERGAQVISLDIGPNLVSYTRNLYNSIATVGSIMHLPFPDAAFQIVFSTEVIEHTPDPLAAVKEMYRVLAPGGHLVLSTPNWIWQFPVRLASRLKLRPYDGLENFVRSDELQKVLSKLGGQIIEHRGIHLLPFQLSFLHPFLRFMDSYGRQLLFVMINQCLHFIKHQR